MMCLAYDDHIHTYVHAPTKTTSTLITLRDEFRAAPFSLLLAGGLIGTYVTGGFTFLPCRRIVSLTTGMRACVRVRVRVCVCVFLCLRVIVRGWIKLRVFTQNYNVL